MTEEIDRILKYKKNLLKNKKLVLYKLIYIFTRVFIVFNMAYINFITIGRNWFEVKKTKKLKEMITRSHNCEALVLV